MAKVTSKLQVTVPKAIADRFGIRAGDEMARLRSFDEATKRQQARGRSRRGERTTERGWTREELYDRARPR